MKFILIQIKKIQQWLVTNVPKFYKNRSNKATAGPCNIAFILKLNIQPKIEIESKACF